MANITLIQKSNRRNYFIDEKQFKSLIVWLEDQKVRFYKIEDREFLRNTESDDWNKAFLTYIQDLSCPYNPADRSAVLDWLLGYAVKLEYGDSVDKYKSMSADKFTEEQKKEAISKSTNPLDALDFEGPDFKAGVASLAQLLKVPPHTDHKEVLKAICLLIKEKFNKDEMDKAGKSYDGKIECIPLDKTDLGFDAGDNVNNEAAKILRLLHIKELRDLQNRINQAIVEVQAMTANPKTDQRLGKVGR
ncbi:RNA transcription, translation and transport factor protein-like isoform X2 [Tubulanus polymorphus]|uniref:RNA transcription, translation and transport factor protein-like isoform X2 n=1 Tax=Tubulanus polymorphus TaxID=672921 RepID=UPI003DA5464F